MKYKNIERGFKRVGVACSLVWFLYVSLAFITYERKGNFDTNNVNTKDYNIDLYKFNTPRYIP